MSASRWARDPCQAAPSISTASIDSSQAASSTKSLGADRSPGAAARTSACPGARRTWRQPQISSSLWQPSASRSIEPRQLGAPGQAGAARQLVAQLARRAQPATDAGDRRAPGSPPGPATPEMPHASTTRSLGGADRESGHPAPVGVGAGRAVHDHSRARAACAHARIDGDVHRARRVGDQLPQGERGDVAGDRFAAMERCSHPDPPAPPRRPAARAPRAGAARAFRPPPRCAAVPPADLGEEFGHRRSSRRRRRAAAGSRATSSSVAAVAPRGARLGRSVDSDRRCARMSSPRAGNALSAPERSDLEERAEHVGGALDGGAVDVEVRAPAGCGGR